MLRKNVAGQFLYFAGVNATTGAALTGATFSVRRAIDGTFAAGGGTITEDTGLGFYKCALTQADTNGNDLAFFFTATNAIPICINVLTTAADPSDTVRFGLTALPNAAAEAAGGLYTRGTGAGQIAQDANGNVRTNLDTIKTQAVTCAAGVTVLASVGTAATSTAQTGDTYTRLGAPAGASVSADIAAVKAQAVAIETDTAEIGAAGAGLTALASAANLATVAGYIDTEIADIQARLPAALVGGRMDATVSAIDGDTTALAAFKAAVRTNVTGTVGAASSTTSIVTSSMTPAASVTDQFKGLIIKFDLNTATAALRGQASDITASTAGGVLTVTALTTAPANGDTFAIL